MKLTQGQPLFRVEVPYNIFQAQYDELGREAVKKISSDYKGTGVILDTLNPKAKEGPINGSNIYFRFALGNAYRELSGQDVLPINPRESEIALANNTLTDPRETYEDLGLVVYPKKGHNPVSWKNQRKIAQTHFKDSINLSIPFVATGLMKPVRDDSFEYGLRLDYIPELTLMYNVPILTQSWNTNTFSSEDPELQKTGFPSKLGEGNRTLYTANTGVLRLYRNWGLVLGAGDRYLAFSRAAGRVHMVAKNSSGNLSSLVERLEQERTY